MVREVIRVVAEHNTHGCIRSHAVWSGIIRILYKTEVVRPIISAVNKVFSACSVMCIVYMQLVWDRIDKHGPHKIVYYSAYILLCYARRAKRVLLCYTNEH